MRASMPQRKAGPSVALSRSPRRPPSRPFGMTRGLGVSAKSERREAKSEKRKADIMRTCKRVWKSPCSVPIRPALPAVIQSSLASHMATSETIDHPAATNAGDTAAAVIQLQDLRHQYGDRTALAGVSFDVRPAEIFGLLGTNGFTRERSE